MKQSTTKLNKIMTKATLCMLLFCCVFVFAFAMINVSADEADAYSLDDSNNAMTITYSDMTTYSNVLSFTSTVGTSGTAVSNSPLDSGNWSSYIQTNTNIANTLNQNSSGYLVGFGGSGSDPSSGGSGIIYPADSKGSTEQYAEATMTVNLSGFTATNVTVKWSGRVAYTKTSTGSGASAFIALRVNDTWTGSNATSSKVYGQSEQHSSSWYNDATNVSSTISIAGATSFTLTFRTTYHNMAGSSNATSNRLNTYHAYMSAISLSFDGVAQDKEDYVITQSDLSYGNTVSATGSTSSATSILQADNWSYASSSSHSSNSNVTVPSNTLTGTKTVGWSGGQVKGGTGDHPTHYSTASITVALSGFTASKVAIRWDGSLSYTKSASNGSDAHLGVYIVVGSTTTYISHSGSSTGHTENTSSGTVSFDVSEAKEVSISGYTSFTLVVRTDYRNQNTGGSMTMSAYTAYLSRLMLEFNVNDTTTDGLTVTQSDLTNGVVTYTASGAESTAGKGLQSQYWTYGTSTSSSSILVPNATTHRVGWGNGTNALTNNAERIYWDGSNKYVQATMTVNIDSSISAEKVQIAWMGSVGFKSGSSGNGSQNAMIGLAATIGGTEYWIGTDSATSFGTGNKTDTSTSHSATTDSEYTEVAIDLNGATSFTLTFRTTFDNTRTSAQVYMTNYYAYLSSLKLMFIGTVSETETLKSISISDSDLTSIRGMTLTTTGTGTKSGENNYLLASNWSYTQTYTSLSTINKSTTNVGWGYGGGGTSIMWSGDNQVLEARLKINLHDFSSSYVGIAWSGGVSYNGYNGQYVDMHLHALVGSDTTTEYCVDSTGGEGWKTTIDGSAIEKGPSEIVDNDYVLTLGEATSFTLIFRVETYTGNYNMNLVYAYINSLTLQFAISGDGTGYSKSIPIDISEQISSGMSGDSTLSVGFVDYFNDLGRIWTTDVDHTSGMVGSWTNTSMKIGIGSVAHSGLDYAHLWMDLDLGPHWTEVYNLTVSASFDFAQGSNLGGIRVAIASQDDLFGNPDRTNAGNESGLWNYADAMWTTETEAITQKYTLESTLGASSSSGKTITVSPSGRYVRIYFLTWDSAWGYGEGNITNFSVKVTGNGTNSDNAFGGSGTEDDPFKLTSRKDFDRLSVAVRGGDTAKYNSSSIYYLVQPTSGTTINFNVGGGDHYFVPIGGTGTYLSALYSRKFYAVIDGNGTTITGLETKKTDAYSGLFGNVSGGRIYNLTIQDPIIAGGASAHGALAGACENGTLIVNCHVTGTGSVTGTYQVGGLVGLAENYSSATSLTVVDCSVASGITVIATTPNGTIVGVGGIVGYAAGVSIRFGGTITNNATPYQNSTDAEVYGVGGILGYTQYAPTFGGFSYNSFEGTSTSCGTTTITNNATIGKADYSYGVGGIVGYSTVALSATASNAYIVNNGDIYGLAFVGGVVGYCAGGTISRATNTGLILASGTSDAATISKSDLSSNAISWSGTVDETSTTAGATNLLDSRYWTYTSSVASGTTIQNQTNASGTLVGWGGGGSNGASDTDNIGQSGTASVNRDQTVTATININLADFTADTVSISWSGLISAYETGGTIFIGLYATYNGTTTWIDANNTTTTRWGYSTTTEEYKKFTASDTRQITITRLSSFSLSFQLQFDTYGGSDIGSMSVSGYLSSLSLNFGTLTDATSSTISGAYAGGIVGYSNGGTLTNCYNSGNVTSTSTQSIVGGLAGSAYKLTYCYSAGTITGASYVGGLVGLFSGTQHWYNYFDGTISGTGSNVGYLFGYNHGDVNNVNWILNNAKSTGSATAHTLYGARLVTTGGSYTTKGVASTSETATTTLDGLAWTTIVDNNIVFFRIEVDVEDGNYVMLKQNDTVIDPYKTAAGFTSVSTPSTNTAESGKVALIINSKYVASGTPSGTEWTWGSDVLNVSIEEIGISTSIEKIYNGQESSLTIPSFSSPYTATTTYYAGPAVTSATNNWGTATSETSFTNAGEYKLWFDVSMSGWGGGSSYAVGRDISHYILIKKATLTVSFTTPASSYTYDGSNQGLTSIQISGLVGDNTADGTGVSVVLTYNNNEVSGAFSPSTSNQVTTYTNASSSINVGSYVVTISGDPDNYSLSGTLSATWSIVKNAINVTWTYAENDKNSVYSGGEVALVATLSSVRTIPDSDWSIILGTSTGMATSKLNGVVNNGTRDVSARTVTITFVDAGDYVMSFDTLDTDNYTLSATSSDTFTITKKQLTVTFNEISGSTYIYSGSDQGYSSVTVSGFVGSDSVSSDSVGISAKLGSTALTASGNVFSVTANTIKNAGSYTITLTGSPLTNYTLSSTSKTWSIAKSALTVEVATSSSITKVYDASTSCTIAPSSYTITSTNGGAVPEQSALSYSAVYDTKDVGTDKTITYTITLANGYTTNYTLASTTATATGSITQRTLTLTFASYSSSYVYLGTDQGSSSVTVGNFASGESLSSLSGITATLNSSSVSSSGNTFTLSSGSYTNAGSYKFSVACTESNYKLPSTTYVSWTIVASKLTFAINTSNAADNVIKVYDGTTSISTTFVFGTDYTLTSSNGGAAATSAMVNSVSAVYGNKNVGTDKTVTFTIALKSSYTTNYTVTNSSVSEDIGVITPATLTITLNLKSNKAVKTYDGSNSFATATYSSGTSAKSAVYRKGLGFVVSGFVNESANITVTGVFKEAIAERSYFDSFVNNVYLASTTTTEDNGTVNNYAIGSGYYKSLQFTLGGDDCANYQMIVATYQTTPVVAGSTLVVYDSSDSANESNNSGGTISIAIEKKSITATYSNTSQSYANADNTYNTTWLAVTGSSKALSNADIQVTNGWMLADDGTAAVYKKYTQITGKAGNATLGATIVDSDSSGSGYSLNYNLRNQPNLVIGYFVEQSDYYEVGSFAGLMMASYYYSMNFDATGLGGTLYEKVFVSTFGGVTLDAVEGTDESGNAYENLTLDANALSNITSSTTLPDMLTSAGYTSWEQFFDAFVDAYNTANSSATIDGVEIGDSGYYGYWIDQEAPRTTYLQFKQVANISGVLTASDLTILEGAFGSNWNTYLTNFLYTEVGSMATVIDAIFPIVKYTVDGEEKYIGFVGWYNGNGYTIEGFNIVSSGSVSSLNNSANVGMFALVQSGTVEGETSYGYVENVQLRNVNISVYTTASTTVNVGGLVGYSQQVMTSANSSFHGIINVVAPNATVNVGGIIGKYEYAENNDTFIANAYIALGTIYATGATLNAGGVIGSAVSTTAITIGDSVSVMSVYAYSSNATLGGIVGSASNLSFYAQASYGEETVNGVKAYLTDSVVNMTTGTAVNKAIGTETTAIAGVTYTALREETVSGYDSNGIYLGGSAKDDYDILKDYTVTVTETTSGHLDNIYESMHLCDLIDIYMLLCAKTTTTTKISYTISGSDTTAEADVLVYQKGTSWLVGSKTGTASDSSDDTNDRIIINNQQQVALLRELPFLSYTLGTNVSMYTGHSAQTFKGAFYGTLDAGSYTINLRNNATAQMFEAVLDGHAVAVSIDQAENN